jgi:hypothetical protein
MQSCFPAAGKQKKTAPDFSGAVCELVQLFN